MVVPRVLSTEPGLVGRNITPARNKPFLIENAICRQEELPMHVQHLDRRRRERQVRRRVVDMPVVRFEKPHDDV
jgi:hypothetical protein